MRRRDIGTCVTTIIALLFAGAANASTDTIGANGINSVATGLTGTGVAIGQVEAGRPGKRVADGGPDSDANASQYIVPAGVFLRSGAAVANMDVAQHSEEVAGVMISTDFTDGDPPFNNFVAPLGVAKNAALYSSAYGSTGNGQMQAAVSSQQVALQNGGDVSAINFSFGEPLGGGTLDGSSLLTEFVDWSASVHDVLYIVAGNQGTAIPIPTDNYNGITVAYSAKVGFLGQYRQVSDGNTYNEDAVGPRTSVSLLAPGDLVELASFGGAHTLGSGTSIAAPHVTGTVALLQQ